MPKSFHTFISGDTDLKNNVFYSGTMNALIKDMLLQNVKKICTGKESSADSLSQMICSVSSDCLDTLNTISNLKRDKHPVLFNLQRCEDNCQLNLGLRLTKTQAASLKNKLSELEKEPDAVAKRKIYDHLKRIKSNEERTTDFFPLLSLALNSPRQFDFYFETISAGEVFLTIRLEIEDNNG